MSELEEVLERLGLQQYHARLVEEGFERWETVLDITEQDLVQLNFKIGHRRLLQREIASARGLDPHASLSPYQFATGDDGEGSEERTSPRMARAEAATPNPSKTGPTGKRKYRRHPKPDDNAPDRPPSAYVMFANKVRDELKGQSLSFTDIAKLVGERWKILPADEKEQYETEASMAKERYNNEFSEYKKTDSYKEYLQYLQEFKAKMAKDSTDQAETSRKRQKLEQGTKEYAIPTANNTRTASISSTGTVSSVYMSSPINALGQLSTSAIGRQPVSPIVLPSPGFQRGYRDTVLNDPRDEPDNFSLSGHDETRHQLGKLHSSASQTPHIQQQLSYARERPPPPRQPSAGSSYLSYSRTPTPLVSSGAPSISSMSSMNSYEDARSSRALPLPTPSISASSTPGYFDNRVTHPAQTLGPSPHPLSAASNQIIHPSSYPPPILSSTAVQPIPQPLNTDSSNSSGGSLPPSGIYAPSRAPGSQ